jgi:hypothetical protein
MQRLMTVRQTRRNNIAKNSGSIFGGYPALYVFKQIIGGAYKRNVMPTSDINDKYLEYENLSSRA